MDPQRVERSQKSRPGDTIGHRPGATAAASSEPSVANLHAEAGLRDRVADLIDSGELNASSDGIVREGRIEQARQNTKRGTYDDYRVLSDVVDRLLTQWNI